MCKVTAVLLLFVVFSAKTSVSELFRFNKVRKVVMFLLLFQTIQCCLFFLAFMSVNEHSFPILITSENCWFFFCRYLRLFTLGWHQ